MNQEISFGHIVKERRTALGLTQAELARRVGCAAITIRKIEADALRPSVQVAELLAIALNIPEKEQLAFIRLARADLGPSPIPTPAPAPEEIGQKDLSGRAIRGFQLGELIGTGGFGVVYKAVQTTVEREVAVKIILPRYANHPDFIRRFEFEAQLVARLEHPFVVPLYDYWRESDAAYLIMRLLRGGSLESVLKHGPLSLEQVNQFVQQIGLALHAAHRAGVIHRDIKPANILLDEDDNAYLADFGIAKDVIIANGSHTEVGGMVGSPAYISPEQIRAEPVKPQADIYCLGIMLFELLTGRKPFAGPTPVAYIQQHLQETPPSLLTINPALPVRLDQVIQKATAKHSADRYPDMLALLADFHQALPTDGISLPATAAFVPDLSTRELAALENPFKGLRPFHEADAADFYGRDTLIQELLTRLSQTDDLSRFLAVVGPSGSGKSSVVRAGLIPALRRGGLPNSDNWFIVEMMPGRQPFEEVEAALLRIAVNPPESLLGQLREDRRGLLRAVQRILPADPDVELLLVIDQFEELFTLVEVEASRAQFLDSLVEAVLDERSRLRLIVTLRADFVDRPLQYVDFGELLRQRSEFVLPLTPDELEQAITRPVSQLGLAVEPELVARIVHEISDQPGTLPLLQYALTELFERRTSAVLTRDLYEASGGVLGALGRRADEIYNSLDVITQTVAKQLFLRLVTLGEGVEDTRRRVRRSELLSLYTPYQSLSFIQYPLDEFGKYRLLTFDNDPLTREPTVEVAHEALLRKWNRLREWLEESRADIRFQRLLAEAAAEWQAAHEDPGFLLRGTRLDQLEGWAERTDIAFTQNEKTFLTASLAARRQRWAEEEARRQRELETARQLAETERQRAEIQFFATQRLRRRAYCLAGISIFAFVVALTAAVLAKRNSTLANENDTRAIALATEQANTQANLELSEQLRLAAEANRVLREGGTGELAALLALQSLQLGYSSQADEALSGALARGFAKHYLIEHTGFVHSLSFSQDGRYLASSGATDQTVRLWDMKTGLKQQSYDIGETNTSVAFSPDGKSILVATFDGYRLIDMQSSEEIYHSPSLGGQAIWAVAFTSDGQNIFVTGNSLTYKFHTSSDESLLRLADHIGPVTAIAVSSDNRFVATGGSDKIVLVRDVQSGEILYKFEGHVAPVTSVAFSPNSQFILTASTDGTARLWDLKSGQQRHQFEIGPANQDFNSWDFAALNRVLGVAFSPDGNTFFISGMDNTVQFRDVESGQLLNSWVGIGGDAIAISPDGKLFAASNRTKITIISLVDADNPSVFHGHTNFISDVAFSPDGQMIVSGSMDQTVKVWDINSHNLMEELKRSNRVLDVSFGQSSKDIWVYEGSRLVGWNMLTGATFAEWDGAFRREGASFSPNGTKVLIPIVHPRGWGQLIEIPSLEIIQEFEFLEGKAAHDLYRPTAVSPNGKIVASSSAHIQNAIDLWDVETGKLLQTLPDQNGGVCDTTVSLDNRFIVTVGTEGIARLWNIDTGEEVRQFVVPNVTISSVVISPDGLMLATGGSDNKVRLYNINTDELLRIYSGHTDLISSMAFSPDGKQLVTGSADKTVRLWPVDIKNSMELACNLLTRDLTQSERDFYRITDEEPTCSFSS